tara:strand:+ start:3352 stop:3696 length:345 start_codon:yes stop_codon:yes gene_type:complete
MSTYAELKPIHFHKSLHLISFASDKRKMAASLLNNSYILHPKDVMNCILCVSRSSDLEGARLVRQIRNIERCLSADLAEQLGDACGGDTREALNKIFNFDQPVTSVITISTDWF